MFLHIFSRNAAVGDTKIRGTPKIKSSIGNEERSIKMEKNKWMPSRPPSRHRSRIFMLKQAMLLPMLVLFLVSTFMVAYGQDLEKNTANRIISPIKEDKDRGPNRVYENIETWDNMVIPRSTAKTFIKAEPNSGGSKRRRLGTCTSGKRWQLGKGGPDECHDCATGKYQNENNHQHLSCKYCVHGEEFNLATTACTSCASGKYQNQNDAASAICKPCQAGKQFRNKRLDCLSCYSGKYQNQNDVAPGVLCKFCTTGTEFDLATTACKSCDSSQYQDENTAAPAVCKFCPAVTNMCRFLLRV